MNNDAAKHTLGFFTTTLSGVGAVSLQRVNEYGSLACWIIGCVAGLCTINSWWNKRRKRLLHEAEQAQSRTRHLERMRKLHEEESSM